MKINTGDFVVTTNRWPIEVHIEVHEVIKVTSKLVFYHEENYNRSVRVRLDDVVFAGDRGTALRLAEQLTSSAALQDQETRAASERRQRRDAKIIKHAKERNANTTTETQAG